MGTISFYDQGVDRAAWHARQGHGIVLVSGTLEVLAQIAATRLDCELELRGVQTSALIRATRLLEERGSWAGRVADRVVQGEEKSRTIQQFVQKKGMDPRNCYAYGNSLVYRAMLSAVGRPKAVNPGRQMVLLANRRDWPIWH